MDALRYNIFENLTAKFDNLGLIGLIKGFSLKQMYREIF